MAGINPPAGSKATSSSPVTSSESSAAAEAISALTNLGYNPAQASAAIATANAANGNVANVIGSGTVNLGNCVGASVGQNSIVFAPALAGATITYTTADFAATPCQ